MTEEEEIKDTVQRLGVSLDQARFIVAINRGEIDGDEIVLQPGQEPATE